MKPPADLCVLTSSYPRSATDDTSVFIQRITEAVAQSVPQVHVIVPFDRQEALYEIRSGVHIHRFKYGMLSPGRLAFGASLLSNLQRNPLLVLQVPVFLLQMLRALFALNSRPDGVLAFWILAAVPAFLFKLMTGTPYLLGLMGSDALIFKNRILTLLSLPLLRAACRVVVVSPSLKELVVARTGLAPSSVEVICNGVEAPTIDEPTLNRFADEHHIDRSRKHLLSVGSLRPMKCFERVIAILSKLPDYHLWLCGKTEQTAYVTQLKDIAEDLRCISRVHFLGNVPPRDIFAYMRLARMYVTASVWEGQPNAVLEAMASRLVVCASDIPPHRELLEDEGGLLFEPSAKPEEIARRIEELEHQPDLEQSMTQRAASVVAGRSWNDCATSYLRLFDKG